MKTMNSKLQKELDSLNKQFNVVCQTAIAINVDRLKYYQELELVNKKCKAIVTEMKNLIQHTKECQEKYGISGDAVIEAAEKVLEKYNEI